MEKVCVGVVGCGAFAGTQHLPNCTGNPKIELTWACDPSEEKLRFAEETFHPRRVSREAGEVFAADDVDMVILAVPHGLHEEMISRAAAAGKHILCEKPMSMSNQESYRIVRHVEKAGVKLCVDYNRRFAPSMVDLRKAFQAHRAHPVETPWKLHNPSRRRAMVEEEATVLLARIQDESSTYRMVHVDPSTGGGQVIGETCHWLDLTCFILEKTPTRIFATGSSRLNHVVTMEFADGSLACILFGVTGTFDYPKELLEIQDHGALFINHNCVENEFYGLVEPVRRTYPLQADDFPDAGREGGRFGYIAKVRARGLAYAASGRKAFGNVIPDKGHSELLDAFVTSILQDRPSPIDERAGARATYLAVRAVESIREGHPLPVNVEELDFYVH
ncbi:MAG: Gfo/Idh/MocA family oxidoreductase [Planctomycetota bacterium]